MKDKNKGKIIGNLALLLGTVIISILMIEAGFRIFWQKGDTFYQPDELIGQIHIPGKTGVWRGGDIENEISINQHGFVGKDYSYIKPDSTYRILVLGDSFVEAMQVPVDRNFSALLEKGLNQRSTTSYQVLNLGVSNFGTGRAYLNLKNYGLKYDPDKIILAFYLGNDLSDNYLEDLNDPSYVVNKEQGVKGKIKKWILKNFKFAQYFKDKLYTSQRLRSMFTRLGVISQPKSEALHTQEQEIPVHLHKYLASSTEFNDLSWKKTDEFMNKILELIDKKNLAIVIIPAREQVYEEDWQEMRDNYYKIDDLEVDLDKPRQDLIRYLTDHRIKYIDLYPTLSEEAKNNNERLYFREDGHFTARGHEVASQAILAHIREIINQ